MLLESMQPERHAPIYQGLTHLLARLPFLNRAFNRAADGRVLDLLDAGKGLIADDDFEIAVQALVELDREVKVRLRQTPPGESLDFADKRIARVIVLAYANHLGENVAAVATIPRERNRLLAFITLCRARQDKTASATTPRERGERKTIRTAQQQGLIRRDIEETVVCRNKITRATISALYGTAPNRGAAILAFKGIE